MAGRRQETLTGTTSLQSARRVYRAPTKRAHVAEKIAKHRRRA